MIFKDIQQRLKPELERLNEYIMDSITAPMPLLNSIVQRYMQKRGKQVRPLLVILCAQLLGEINDRTLHSGAAIEILHNASLIHDDVIDQSTTRRGEPTLNAVWNNHIAVLTGDYLLSKALDESMKAESMEIMKRMIFLSGKLTKGELYQIFLAREHEYSMRDYAKTIEMKTAILFESCARIGAESVGVDELEASSLIRYAYYLGMCFQIRDDVYDYQGNEAFGKDAGNDLREGKVTLPLIFALQNAPTEECVAMKALLDKGDLSDEDVKTLTQFAVDNGGIEFCGQVMERLRQKAVRCLSRYKDCSARKDLEDIFTFIINRDH